MNSGHNQSARAIKAASTSVRTMYTAFERSSIAATRKENQRPADKVVGWRPMERGCSSGERVTGHVTESTRCSRDRPRDVTRTCRIAW